MRHRAGTALAAALASSLAVAAVLTITLSSPSEAVLGGDLDQAAVSAAVTDAALTFFPAAPPGTPPPSSADGVGAFDPESAMWHLRTRAGDPTVFIFGAPGSIPLMGDWDGDGIDTVGTYDPTTAIVNLRNSNTPGNSDVEFTLGNPGDLAIAGDFDGDGTDTIAIFRPSDDFVRVYNATGDGLGEPDATYTPAATAGALFAGDFDGDGTDTIASCDPMTGTVTINTPGGALDSTFAFTAPGSLAFAGDWTGDGSETVGAFESAAATMHLLFDNTDGGADESYAWGSASWIPVAGAFGDLASPVTVTVEGAPQGLAWAVESLYLESDQAPSFEGAADDSMRLLGVTDALGVEGVATTSEAYGGQVAVVRTDTDTILAVSDDGWEWRVVGGNLASTGYSLMADAPRFVTIIGADNNDVTDPLTSFADSIHIYGVNAAGDEGAIVGIPRDTAMAYDGPEGPRVEGGMAEISHTMLDLGPDVTTETIATETGLPIDGWFVTGFGTVYTPTPGFSDLVDAMGGIDYLDIPYSAPSQCIANPPGPRPAAGDSHVDGYGALTFSRERKCVPTEHFGTNAHTSNAVRTLSQGLLMKAAVAEVQELGISALPGLLSTMDDYVWTNLSSTEVFTLAATLFDIDPGPMPTLGPDDLDRLGYAAYNLNPGNLPNVVVEGCNGYLWKNDAGQINFNQFYVRGHYNTFRDFADGTLDTLPVYEYDSGIPGNPYTCDKGEPKDWFIDDDDSVFEPDINWMAEEGITRGCNPPVNDRYCPDSNVTRGQMAAFLVRALGLTERLDNPFTDDDDSIFEADIERLAAAGITRGCNPPANTRFCPDSNVTREQMAAFLVRALGYTDDGGGDLFIDDDDSIFEGDIDRLGTAGVTRGCNPPANTRFCPGSNVTRGQMAAFLHRALG